VYQIILISGHRGYKAKEIENSKSAFERAIKENLDYIELDIRKTADEKLVVFHNYKINKLLNGRGRVHKHTLKQLKAFRYQDGQKILTFEETINLIKGRIKVIIDVKSRGIEEKILGVIRANNVPYDHIIIQSAFKSIIKEFFIRAPDLDYAIYRAYIGNLGWFLGKFLRLHKLTALIFYRILIKNIPVNYVSLDGPFIYDEFISLLLKKNLKIILGAMKIEKYLKNIKKWNISLINVNNPAKIRYLLNLK